MSKLKQLASIGQSIWYDTIRRSFLLSQEMNALIDLGLRGMTSNPSIFEQAISGSSDYDESIRLLSQEDRDVEEISEILVLEDIAMAADRFRTVYDATQGIDGYVCLEVSPRLANNTQGTVDEARRLFEVLKRPNIMIKVPATPAGIPAIRVLIGQGVNINVTLIFSVGVYREVVEAYLKGVEDLAANGPRASGGLDVTRIASVASFFLSRIDTAVDAILDQDGHGDLIGKTAIANAKKTYSAFKELFSGPRWNALKDRGARVQRPLWASTGTKDPRLSNTLYVDELIGPDTVNTIPPATLTHFQDHGIVGLTVTQGLKEAESHLDRLKAIGIDLSGITKKLQDQGVAAFSQSFQTLMASISEKRDRLAAGDQTFTSSLNHFKSSVDQHLQDMRAARIMNRIWDHDHTVWKDDPEEINNRLGWLHSPEVMADAISQISAYVDGLRHAGFTQALLLGMGGSSLAPEMFRLIFGVAEGYLDLSVCDSTDPGAVLDHESRLDPKKTIYIVSTKSGGTVETLSLTKYFYQRVMKGLGKERVGSHFMAITDPGSGLEAMARQWNFRRIFLNDPNIGGRYSALSYFGLVPAAMIGVDLNRLLKRAGAMACNTEGCNCPVSGDNTGARLGAIISGLAQKGRDKLTLVPSPAIAPFGAWLEQLIAESLGKEGHGILPVDGEDLLAPDLYARDRLFVMLHLGEQKDEDMRITELRNAGHPAIHIYLKDRYDLGGEFFRWEMATAVAGHFFGINPFDQPNVESAKVLARDMVAAYHRDGNLPEISPTFEKEDIQGYTKDPVSDIRTALEQFLSQADPGKDETIGRSYVAIQAYITPGPEAWSALHTLRGTIQKRTRLATTVGYGPRFLHSTGQLHKGDGGQGLFIQITSQSSEDIPIPDQIGKDGSTMSFGVLKMAQALGDRQALLEAGRRVIRFHMKGDVIAGLKRIAGEVV